MGFARRSVLLLTLGVALAAAGTAHAAAGWLPSRDGDPGDAQHSLTGDTDPVFDTDGTLVVVTERYDIGQATYLPTAYVRPPGGEFTRQQLTTDSGVLTDVAVDPRGGVAVAWMVGTDIKIVRRPPGGSFGAVETLPTNLPNVFGVQMGIGPDGRETFVVSQSYTKGADTGFERLRVLSRPGPNQPVDSTQIVSPNVLDTDNGRIGRYDLAVGPTGAAALAFEFQDNYPTSFAASLRVVRRSGANAAGPFGGPQTLVPTTGDPSSEHIALDASGRATIAFASVVGGARRARVADAPADTGAFGAAVPLSPEATNPNHNYAFLALAPDGSAVIGFGGGGQTATKYVTRRGPMPSTFDPPQRIDTGLTNTEPPEVAIGADGVAYAVLRSGNVFNSDLDAWRSPGPGQPFESTRVANAAAAGDAFEYGIGSFGTGTAVVLYKGKLGNDGQKKLVAVPYDSVAPKIALSAPASLFTGVPGDFTVAPSDYWGPLTTTLSFDDGGSGTPHAYATTGTHTATATTTDATGLSATATAQTVVSNAPPGSTSTAPGTTSTGTADKVPPKLRRLLLKKRQRVLSGLKVALTAEEDTVATLSAKVTVRCPGKRARSFSLRSTSVKLAKGAQSTVVLKASKKTKGRLRAALACKGAKATAKVRVAMTDSAHNTAQVSTSAAVR